MKKIANQTFPNERALYNTQDALILSCRFEGEEDGESALKESRNISVEDCYFALRYPLWHASNFEVKNCQMTETCRAPIWYATDGNIISAVINGVKAVRECSHIQINDSKIFSPEFGWKCNDIKINNTSLESEYAFFDSKDIEVNNIEFKGKYSFQYASNVVIKDSNLDTKDAFWHSHNVTVINSVIKGEYLGWFSDGLTIINCKIIGTQPLCYCKNLKIIDSEMIDADLSFEYSEVDVSVKGRIDSVKNPKSGTIIADEIGEIITSNSIMENTAVIKVRK